MKLLGGEIAKKIEAELASLPKPEKELVVVQIGNDPVSSLYVKKKQEFAQSIGISTRVARPSLDKVHSELISLARNDSVRGIIIQLPIPENLDREELLRLIPKEKDVDGFRFILGDEYITYPPTVLAIDEIIKFYKIPLKKGILIVGRGFLVGQPLEKYLKNKGIPVQVLEKNDDNYFEILRKYDVVVVATGGGHYFEQSEFKEGAFVIDASTVQEENKVRGDVSPIGELINLCPVPGGVGPVTVAMLYKNFFLL